MSNNGLILGDFCVLELIKQAPAMKRYMSFRSSRRSIRLNGSYPVESGGLPIKVKKGKGSSKKIVEPWKALTLEEAQLEIQQQHKTLFRQAPVRSQTFDADRGFGGTEGTGSQSSFIKHNKTFHKLFPDIPESEDLLHAYICALQKEVPYHGRLYITDTHACFYSSVLLKDTKVVIPTSGISVLKKQNMALLVPNALSIRMSDGDKYLFVSLRNREGCFQLLRSVCPRLEDSSTNSSPLFSSAESSFDRGRLVNSSQSSLEDSFDQLDGSEQGLLLKQPSPRPRRDAASTETGSSFRSTHSQLSDSSSSEELSVGGSWVWSVKEKAKSLLIQRESSTLNTLLFVYLILVVLLLLSSGYIGLRIVALEEQLTSLGALSEFSLQSGYKGT